MRDPVVSIYNNCHQSEQQVIGGVVTCVFHTGTTG